MTIHGKLTVAQVPSELFKDYLSTIGHWKLEKEAWVKADCLNLAVLHTCSYCWSIDLASYWVVMITVSWPPYLILHTIMILNVTSPQIYFNPGYTMPLNKHKYTCNQSSNENNYKLSYYSIKECLFPFFSKSIR